MKMKKILTILLAVLLACGAFPVGAMAEEQSLFQYEVKADGTAEITGINKKFIETLEIPAVLDGYPVMSIGNRAFMGCEKLQSVVIPEGVVSVGDYAFWNCPALESVSIPDSLVSVDRNPFCYCPKLKTVEVSPDHPVFAVENRALVSRRDQTLIVVLDHEGSGMYTVPQEIRRIEDYAFDNCRFSSIVLPDSVRSIGNLAFSNCENLTGMILPEGVERIGSQAFCANTNFESVTIPDSLTRIGEGVFGNTPALTAIRISPDHPVYEMNGPLLVDKRSQEIIAVLSNISEAFEIPEGIRAIESLAFQGCHALTELLVPEGVTRIGYNAFCTCINLQVITFPASLNEIGDYAFEYCAEDLLIRAPAGSWAEQYARENGYRFEALPADTEEAATEEQGLFRYEIKEDGTAQITKADESLTDCNIPAELDGIPVTSIGSDAFYDCRNLRSVVIPEGVVSVGMFAFCYCTKLESVVFPDSLVSLGAQAFAYNYRLKTVEVSPDHPVFAVENRALVNRQEQELIYVLDRQDPGTYTVAQGIRKIGDNAFSSCFFSSIILPDSVTSVGDFAFSFCENLTEMILPDGVTDVGFQEFFGCKKLESITIPDSVTRIGSGVFGDNPALTDVRISPDHPAYEMIGHLLVDRREQKIVMALNSTPVVFEIPEGIQKIRSLAFQGSSALTELIVPEGVTDMGSGAFSGCFRLRVVTLPASLTEIGEEAFEYCHEDLLIKAPAGSTAEEYAREKGYRFEALPESAD